MGKIPVGATIAQAYRFAFRDFLKILAVMWLPFVILACGGFALMRQAMALSNAITTHDFAAAGSALLILIPFYVVLLILMCMQIVGITQEALQTRTGSPYYYFSLGKTMWRLIGAYLLIFLFIVIAYAAVLLAGVILTAVVALLIKLAHLSGIASGLLGLIGFVAFIAGFCAYIYAIVRLTFFLAPVIVAEENEGIKRSWQMGKSNFWRMFAIILAILIPLMAIEMTFMIGFVFRGLPPFPMPGATADQLAAIQMQTMAWNNAAMTRMVGEWYATLPFLVVFSVIFYGAACGAQAFAYRAVTRPEMDGPWT